MFEPSKFDCIYWKSGDPAASDLSLHCLPINLLGVSRLEWVLTVFAQVCLSEYLNRHGRLDCTGLSGMWKDS